MALVLVDGAKALFISFVFIVGLRTPSHSLQGNAVHLHDIESLRALSESCCPTSAGIIVNAWIYQQILMSSRAPEYISPARIDREPGTFPLLVTTIYTL